MKTSYQAMITSNMVDPKDNLKPESMLDIFQSAAKMNARTLGLGQDSLMAKGYAYVVLRIKFQILSQITNADFVTITTWPNKKDKIEFRRQFDIKDENNNLKVIGSSTWVVIDFKERRIMRSEGFDFSQEVKTTEAYFDEIKRINVRDLELEEVGTYQVSPDDIDKVGHLNNSKYLKILYNFDPSLYKEIQIDFIKETKLGETLTIKTSFQDGYHYMLGYIGSNLHFVVKYVKED